MYPYPVSAARPGSVVGRTLGFVAAAMGVSAVAALASPAVPRGLSLLLMLVAIVGIFALKWVKEKPGINVAIFFFVAAAIGLGVGSVIDTYLQRGLGGIVVDAAGTTAVIAAGAGIYGYTTNRDLSRLGSILFFGLIGVVIASLVGIFVHLPLLGVIVSAAAAAVFTGYIVYDINRVAHAGEATEGDVIVLALGIYLDLINLFLAILRILGFLSSRE
jgi:FtsH-binding integral membrane protein